jgi:ABC-2 type transport system ATP-binding protein
MLLHIDGLRQSIGGHEILHDVHLSLGKGDIYGLIGPNGAGKSTTIAAALGLLTRSAGRIEVLGHDPQTEAALIHARLGVLPEQNGFYDWMSAPEYLEFFAALYGRVSAKANIEKYLGRVGLTAPTDQPIGTFSRGMRQRLGLARALVPDPQLLILDEPTNGLDPRGRREIHDILSELAANGVGILLCTHILDDVERLCHRIGIIVEGRTVAEGGIVDLVGESAHRSRFRLRLRDAPPKSASHPSAFKVIAHQGEWWSVNLDPAISPEAAWREALFSGWPIIEIEREGGGLEDLYLALTEGNA